MTDLKLFSADSPEWGAMFIARNDSGAKTSHDMAHGIGSKVRFDGDFLSYDKLPIVKLINDTFAEAGISFRLTDTDASNFTLLPGNGNNFDGTNLGSKTNGVQSALIQKVATHGNHVAAFDRVLTGGADGTQFLDELHRQLKKNISVAENPDQKLRFEKGKKLPDFAGAVPGGNNQCATSILVSPRLKSLIEAHQTDADGWNFFPVDIYQKDGTLYDTYYVWWVHRVVDALDEDSPGIRSVLNSDVTLKNYPDASGNYAGPRSPERQRVRKSVIANLSAWIDYRFFPSKKIFISDALYQAIVNQGMTNFQPDSVWGEV